MNVSHIVNQPTNHLTPQMHKIRCKVLVSCVGSMLHGNPATVTAIGRGIKSSSSR
jgi:hypothetical protein